MATLKQRLHKKNSSGTYDIVHLETSASLVLMANGTTVEAAINGKAASSHNHGAGNITSGTLAVVRGGTGVTTLDALKSALGISSNGNSGASYNLTNIAVGKRVWFSYSWWKCVHINGSTYYLILDKISQTTVFGNNNRYSASIIATLCPTFQNEMAEDSLAICVDTTVNGVTSKVFIPSYEQCNGGFSYFNSHANRIAYMNNVATSWWTSSLTNGAGWVYGVRSDGAMDLNDPSNTLGFRPCVAISL